MFSKEQMEEIYNQTTDKIVDRILDTQIKTQDIQNEFETIAKELIKTELQKNSATKDEPSVDEINSIFAEVRKIQWVRHQI